MAKLGPEIPDDSSEDGLIDVAALGVSAAPTGLNIEEEEVVPTRLAELVVLSTALALVVTDDRPLPSNTVTDVN